MDSLNINMLHKLKSKKIANNSKYDIYTNPNQNQEKKFYTQPTGKYTLYSPEKNIKNELSKNKKIESIPYNLYYANPNNYTKDPKTDIIISKNQKTNKENSQITTLQSYIKDPKNQNKLSLYQYKIFTTKSEDPFLDISEIEFENKKNKMSKEEIEISKMTGRFLINTIKQNKLTKGLKEMMNNERIHSQESIESGIYITWSIKLNNGKEIDCFRIGSKNFCICGHGFNNHDKILNKNNFSNKCKICSCNNFKYIPIYPEEIGEFWIPFQKYFSYDNWKAKCKCKHTWNYHFGNDLKCNLCNCNMFHSDFCCVVCNKFWEDHFMIYDLENDRIKKGKPVREDFIPFNEMPEMYDALYN